MLGWIITRFKGLRAELRVKGELRAHEMNKQEEEEGGWDEIKDLELYYANSSSSCFDSDMQKPLYTISIWSSQKIAPRHSVELLFGSLECIKGRGEKIWALSLHKPRVRANFMKWAAAASTRPLVLIKVEGFWLFLYCDFNLWTITYKKVKKRSIILHSQTSFCESQIIFKHFSWMKCIASGVWSFNKEWILHNFSVIRYMRSLFKRLSHTSETLKI